MAAEREGNERKGKRMKREAVIVEAGKSDRLNDRGHYPTAPHAAACAEPPLNGGGAGGKREGR